MFFKKSHGQMSCIHLSSPIKQRQKQSYSLRLRTKEIQKENNNRDHNRDHSEQHKRNNVEPL